MCAGDMAAIPLVKESVDAILCYGALHHVPDWQNAIYEFFRVLRPGGVLVLQEPGKGHNKTAESKSQMEQFGVLEQDLPAGTLVSSCRKAGFSKAIIRPISELSLGRIRIMPSYRFRPEVPFLFLRQRLRLLKATLTESLLNIVSPLHIIVAVKGKAFADSKKPEIMRARFELVECPEILEKSKETPIHIRILNTGLSLWLSDTGKSTLGQVNIGISLLDSSGKIKDLDFLRIRLPCDVKPGDRMDVFGNIPSLMDSGLVMLRFDLVSEGVYWFSDRGSKPVYHKCRVN
ncbi:MAG: class I SAM-dependent methyltransferase [Candidatus Theseobacter exili]|nr:class I SAM-dependent methyltransferase [Candidatus Theseobacter exili]